MRQKPKGENELERKEIESVTEQLDMFDSNIRSLNLDNLNRAPIQEQESVHKISQAEIAKSQDIYLKPRRSIGSRERFNENYRKEYTFATEFVNFIAENKEIIGESIEMWTKPFAGMPAEEWVVPVGKPVWAPRHVAEQIKRSRYHRLISQQNTITNSDGMGQYYGGIIAETTVQRLDATPIAAKRSIFMGTTNF